MPPLGRVFGQGLKWPIFLRIVAIPLYAVKPDMQTMLSHCDMLVKHYQEIATELTAMAEMHKKMGAMGGMAR
jgi:hypothetical protein